MTARRARILAERLDALRELVHAGAESLEASHDGPTAAAREHLRDACVGLVGVAYSMGGAVAALAVAGSSSPRAVVALGAEVRS